MRIGLFLFLIFNCLIIKQVLGQVECSSDTDCPGSYCKLDHTPPVCQGYQCLTDEQCQNSLFCDGTEWCDPSSNTCQFGPPACGGLICDEFSDSCLECSNDAHCSNGKWCDGFESCGSDNTCIPGVSPCPINSECSETLQQCIYECQIDRDCSDGLVCNGIELCIDRECVPGTEISCPAGMFCSELIQGCDVLPSVLTDNENDGGGGGGGGGEDGDQNDQGVQEDTTPSWLQGILEAVGPENATIIFIGIGLLLVVLSVLFAVSIRRVNSPTVGPTIVVAKTTSKDQYAEDDDSYHSSDSDSDWSSSYDSSSGSDSPSYGSDYSSTSEGDDSDTIAAKRRSRRRKTASTRSFKSAKSEEGGKSSKRKSARQAGRRSRRSISPRGRPLPETPASPALSAKPISPTTLITAAQIDALKLGMEIAKSQATSPNSANANANAAKNDWEATLAQKNLERKEERKKHGWKKESEDTETGSEADSSDAGTISSSDSEEESGAYIGSKRSAKKRVTGKRRSRTKSIGGWESNPAGAAKASAIGADAAAEIQRKKSISSKPLPGQSSAASLHTLLDNEIQLGTAVSSDDIKTTKKGNGNKLGGVGGSEPPKTLPKASSFVKTPSIPLASIGSKPNPIPGLSFDTRTQTPGKFTPRRSTATHLRRGTTEAGAAALAAAANSYASDSSTSSSHSTITTPPPPAPITNTNTNTNNNNNNSSNNNNNNNNNFLGVPKPMNARPSSTRSVSADLLTNPNAHSAIETLSDEDYAPLQSLFAVTSPANMGLLSQDVTTIYDYFTDIRTLLQLVFELELDIFEDDVTSMFAPASPASGIMAALFKLYGSEWRRRVLNPVIASVLKSHTKESSDLHKRPIARMAMETETKKVLKMLGSTKTALPATLREMLRLLKEILDECWPDGSVSAEMIHQALVVDFVCPAIADPIAFGLVSSKVSEEKKAVFEVMAKTLARIAQRPSVTRYADPSLDALDEFVSTQTASALPLILKNLVSEKESDLPSFSIVSSREALVAFQSLFTALQESRSEVSLELDERGLEGKPLVRALEKSMASVPGVVDRSSIMKK